MWTYHHYDMSYGPAPFSVTTAGQVGQPAQYHRNGTGPQLILQLDVNMAAVKGCDSAPLWLGQVCEHLSQSTRQNHKDFFKYYFNTFLKKRCCTP